MKKIEYIKPRHFPKRIVSGVQIPANDMLTDKDVIDKVNQLIDVVNKLMKEK